MSANAWWLLQFCTVPVCRTHMSITQIRNEGISQKFGQSRMMSSEIRNQVPVSNQSLSDDESLSWSETYRISILLNCGRWWSSEKRCLSLDHRAARIAQHATARVVRGTRVPYSSACTGIPYHTVQLGIYSTSNSFIRSEPIPNPPKIDLFTRFQLLLEYGTAILE